MESTANIGTASLEASHGPFSLQAQWDDRGHDEASKSVAWGVIRHNKRKAKSWSNGTDSWRSLASAAAVGPNARPQ